MKKIHGYNPELSIVIPCFNEAENVVLLLAAVAKAKRLASIDFEVIIVDGGSTDETVSRITTQVEILQISDVVSLKVSSGKKGYGADICLGLESARGDVLAWTHADMQTDIADVIRAFFEFKSASETGAKVLVKGRRTSRPLFDALFTFGMQMFTLAVTKRNLVDINAQPKLFNRDFLENHLLVDPPDDFSLDLYAYYIAVINGYVIKKIPVVYKARQFGAAKGGGGSLYLKLQLVRRTVSYIMNSRVKFRRAQTHDRR